MSEALLLAALARPDVSFFLVRDGRSVARVAARRFAARPGGAGVRRERTARGCLGRARARCSSRRTSRPRAGARGRRRAPPPRQRPPGAGPGPRARRRAGVRLGARARALPGRRRVRRGPAASTSTSTSTRRRPRSASPMRGRCFDAVTRELHAVARARVRAPRARHVAGVDGRARRERCTAPGSAAAARPAGSSSRRARPRAARDPWRLARRRASRSAPGSLAETTRDAHAGAPPIRASSRARASTRRSISSRRCASMFLVCSGADGLYVLDQHAAAERVTFDRLRKAFASRTIATQRLLIPDVIELLPTEVAPLEEHARTSPPWASRCAPSAPSAVAVHAVPTLLARARPERLVRDLVAELGRADRRPVRRRRGPRAGDDGLPWKHPRGRRGLARGGGGSAPRPRRHRLRRALPARAARRDPHRL